MVSILRLISVGGVSLAIAILVLALSPPGGSHLHLTRTMMPARGPLIARADHPEWRQLLINAALRRADELSQLRQLPDAPLPSEITEPEKSGIDINEPEKPSAENVRTAPEFAGVPPNRSDAEPEDVTGTVAQSPEAAIPVDIGEASSTELPVIRTPELSRPPHEGLELTPESTKPAQEKESAKAALESDKLTEDTTKAASEPAKPARESKKAETVPAKPARERGRRVRPRHYTKVVEKPPPPPFNLLEAFFASFNLDPRTGKPRYPIRTPSTVR